MCRPTDLRDTEVGSPYRSDAYEAANASDDGSGGSYLADAWLIRFGYAKIGRSWLLAKGFLCLTTTEWGGRTERRLFLEMGFAAPTSRSGFRLRLAWIDLVWAVASPIIALALRDPTLLYSMEGADLTSPAYIFIVVAICAAVFSLLLFRLNDGMSHLFTVHDLRGVAGATGLAVAVTSVVLFTFTRLDGVPRSTPTIYALVFGGGLILIRVVHRAFARERARQSSADQVNQLRNVVIIGADRFAASIVELMASQTPRTTRVIALLDENSKFVGRAIAGVRVVGSASDLEQVLSEYEIHGVGIDQVLISTPDALSDEVRATIELICSAHEIPCTVAADAFNLWPKLEKTEDSSPERVSAELPRYFQLKRVFDFTASIVLLILLLPVAALVSILVLIDVGAPLLFWQERLGRNGRRFLVYKFRTYRAPFDWRGEPVPEERRLSKIGKFVRATRLDEIPQLLNVLVGDMSLIGPRPLLPHDQPADPSTRLRVSPGITGWAQVNGGNLVTPEEKDALDIWYIDNASWSVDVRILLKTFVVAVGGERRDRIVVDEAIKFLATRARSTSAE